MHDSFYPGHDYYQATNWNFVNPTTSASAGGSEIVAGTGFMPTNGIYNARIFTVRNDGLPSLGGSIYQDNVDFSKSKSLTFDYLISGAVGPHTQGYSSPYSIEINILFTGNGTDTLWTKTISGSSDPYAGPTLDNVQKKDEIISLPSLPVKGRFTIKVVTTTNVGLDYQIDNIRVQ